MKYLIDTSAWIEAFLGTRRGEKVKRILDNKRHQIIVSDSTFAEIYNWATKNDHDPGLLIKYVRDVADVYEIYVNIWVEAAEWRDRMRKKSRSFGLADALLLAIQKHTGAKIVSCDSDFSTRPNVLML